MLNRTAVKLWWFDDVADAIEVQRSVLVDVLNTHQLVHRLYKHVSWHKQYTIRAKFPVPHKIVSLPSYIISFFLVCRIPSAPLFRVEMRCTLALE